MREVLNDKDGIKPFVGPQAERIKVSKLLDALKADYELRGKWNDRADSTFKKAREYFGPWKAVDVSSEAVADWQLLLREEGYRDATINRFCQVLCQSFKLASSAGTCRVAPSSSVSAKLATSARASSRNLKCGV